MALISKIKNCLSYYIFLGHFWSFLRPTSFIVWYKSMFDLRVSLLKLKHCQILVFSRFLQTLNIYAILFSVSFQVIPELTPSKRCVNYRLSKLHTVRLTKDLIFQYVWTFSFVFRSIFFCMKVARVNFVFSRLTEIKSTKKKWNNRWRRNIRYKLL